MDEKKLTEIEARWNTESTNEYAYIGWKHTPNLIAALRTAQSRVAQLEAVYQAARDVTISFDLPEGTVGHLIFDSLWEELKQAIAQLEPKGEGDESKSN